MTPTAKTVLYVRVSTSEQTSDHQLAQAREAGFLIADDHVITDHGVSGVSVRLADRDQGRRLFDLLQPNDTLLVRWVDRLGRNYEDVKEVIETFNKKGVTVRTVINQMTFEADHKLTDPTMKAARAAILAFMSALAEADATAKRESRQAGIDHAKASADADRKYRGKKPSYDRSIFDAVQTMLAQNARTVSQIARETGLSRQAVLRIRDTPEAADVALHRWGM
ncbi:recombinase family protein [Falsiruegeria mediterranea]|uniref:recombinase family protein n=1 Tax=Falsiruegeria mediterranea TaxID=1280832 RepID=UPI0015F26288|nr:recombinase family protein [Falsiruegeria mediterranea]